jgi:hypothetical protein
MRPHPLVYEINTRCWLNELSQKTGETIQLGNVPDEQFVTWRRLGFTHIWLMGVWATGPRGRNHSLSQPGLRETYREILPDWQERDVLGSPYAVADYQVSQGLGGESGLRHFRQRLHRHGLKLIIDFVANHLGLDHPWISEHPDLFIQGPANTANTFRRKTPTGSRWFAYGKDPNFPAWTDTVQLDYRRAKTRAVMIDALRSIGQLCDGVRCDMAMLLLNDVFEKVWEGFPCCEPHPEDEFWPQAIEQLKQTDPDFLFVAEAYWGLEKRLQDLGFDYTYDKRFYDHLVARNHGLAQRHLTEASPAFVERSVHFLENHDEPRITSLLSFAEHRAAALATLGSPGMRLLHEGQLDGARLQSCIHLGRRAWEEPQPEVTSLYGQLLDVLQKTSVGRGQGMVLKALSAWEGNSTNENFIVIQWQESSPEFDLVVANLAAHQGQCHVPLAIDNLAQSNWQMKDLLGDELYDRPGHHLKQRGLYLDLPPHGAQLFHFQPCG